VPRFLSWCVLKTLPFPALQSPAPSSHNHPNPALDRLANTAALIASLCGHGKAGTKAGRKRVSVAAWFFLLLAVVVALGMNLGNGFLYTTLYSIIKMVPYDVANGLRGVLSPIPLPKAVTVQMFFETAIGQVFSATVDLLLTVGLLLWLSRLFVAHCLRERAGALIKWEWTVGEPAESQPKSDARSLPVFALGVARQIVGWVWRMVWLAVVVMSVWSSVAMVVLLPALSGLWFVRQWWTEPSNRSLVDLSGWNFDNTFNTFYALGWWALNIPTLVAVLIFWFSARLAHHITARDLQRECSGCGYALEGNTSGVCPECGQPRSNVHSPTGESEPLTPYSPPHSEHRV
jgi:hypothetical protein